jgi:hypothetical protein
MLPMRRRLPPRNAEREAPPPCGTPFHGLPHRPPASPPQVVNIKGTGAGKTASGADYAVIPAAGGSGRKTGVPCLELEPGVTVTEGPAVLQAIAAKGETRKEQRWRAADAVDWRAPRQLHRSSYLLHGGDACVGGARLHPALVLCHPRRPHPAAPSAGLAPAFGSVAYWRTVETSCYLSSEVRTWRAFPRW